MSDPESLGEIIARRRVPAPRNKKLKLEMVSLNWKNIAGERMGRHSAPTRLSRGTLTIAAEGSSWAAEISAETPVLLKRVREVMGDDNVKKLKIQARETGSCAEAGESQQGVQSANSREAALGEEVKEELGSIAEKETRSALEGMLRASVASRQSKQDDG